MILIAETFNAGSPTVRAALQAGDRGWVEASLRRQVQTGVDYIECNASGFGPAEADILRWLVEIVEVAADVPVSVDSADPSLLAQLARGRRRPSLLNAIDATGIPPAIAAAVRDGAQLVIQLRKGARLPGTGEREAWAEEILTELARQDLPPASIFLDPVLLPWGADLDAGAPLLAFLDWCRSDPRHPQTLVGLSNVSWGHADRRRVHRQWLPRLRTAGLDAAILDPFDSALVAAARD